MRSVSDVTAAAARRPAWRRPPGRRVRAIRDRLRLVYGVPAAKPHGHPIAELILTVLSQSTNDRNRDVAYLALRERFDNWEAIRDARVDEIEEAIRPGGISRIKSARIKAILQAIPEGLDRYNSFSYPPHRQNSSLRRMNNCVEGIYPVHA